MISLSSSGIITIFNFTAVRNRARKLLNVFDTNILTLNSTICSYNNVFENGSHYLEGSSCLAINRAGSVSFKDSMFKNCVSYQETPCVTITNDESSESGKYNHVVSIY